MILSGPMTPHQIQPRLRPSSLPPPAPPAAPPPAAARSRRPRRRRLRPLQRRCGAVRGGSSAGAARPKGARGWGPWDPWGHRASWILEISSYERISADGVVMKGDNMAIFGMKIHLTGRNAKQKEVELIL